MTCIAAITDGKAVTIGGDSAGVAGLDITVRGDTKVFENGPMVFGFTTSFRMGQLLRHTLSVPKHHEGDDDAFMCTTFIDAVRKCLKDGGWGSTDDGRERGGEFIVGYHGRIWVIQGDFQVGEPADNFAACGCGGPYALGRLWGSTGTPTSRVEDALATAERFSGGVRAPFTIITGGAK